MLVTLSYKMFITFQQQDDFKLQNDSLLKFSCFIRLRVVSTSCI